MHRFDNLGSEDVKQLAVVTPAIMGPTYFREAAEVIGAAAGGPPDRVKMMGEMESLQTNLNERREGSAELKSRWDTAHDAWQHSLGDLRAEVEQLKTKAAAIEASLPERLRREFHRIFKQRQNVAIARVVADSCSGCRTRVRPAVMQQLKRGDLVHCEGCSRILYLETPPS